MKIWHIILASVVGVSGCSNDESKNNSSNIQSDSNSYLSKEQVVQGFLTLSRGSGLNLHESESTPIDPETGKPYQLLPTGTFEAESGPSSGLNLDESSQYLSSQDTDLRPWASPVKNQGREQTCTAFSTIGAMEIAAKIKTGRDFNLSERHLWSLDQQGAVATIVSAASKRAIIKEEVWPYTSRQRPASASTATGVARIAKFSGVLNVSGILQALKNRQPVVFGGTMPAYNSKGIVYGLNNAGQHAMAIVGAQIDSRIKSGGYFIVRNSYGPNDGDKGYIYLPFSYCAQTCWARAIEDIEISGAEGTPINGQNDKIMAMIGNAAQGSSDSYTMWMSAPSGAARLVFCTEAQASACKVGARGYTETTLNQTIGTQAIFKANSALALSNGLQISVAAFNASGQMITSRSLKIEQN